MRLLEYSYKSARIFSERIFGYKRYYVQWENHPHGRETMYSGLWYNLNQVREIVKKEVDKE